MLGEIIADLSNWMYTYLLVILLVAAGLFFTIRNRFPQLRLLREAIRVVVERPEKEGSVSSFQALMVSTASRVGTGNIIGVSVAICMGGYGAVFWMWLIALLGGATAFTESTLAQIYKRRNPETGESYGGPAYYIEAALHSRPLAVLFALSLIATYAGGFNMLCSYNLQSTFSGYSFYSPEWTPWIIGGIVALLTGYCVMGGGKRIIAFASTLVPIMGGLYVLVALVVIFNLVNSRTGRAVMAARDNRIAAESVGISVTKYKMIAFVTSAALAGAAGTLYGCSQTTFVATKFDFNTSILILVFVVLGGLGNMWGSVIAAAALTILPEALRQFADYRMLVYAIVLILVMLATNNPAIWGFFARLRERREEKKGGAAQ